MFTLTKKYIGVFSACAIVSFFSLGLFLKRWYKKPYITQKGENKIPERNPDDIYISDKKKRFFNTYIEYDSDHFQKYNSTIDPVFYTRDKYAEIMKLPENWVELFWRRRILFESTPKGNVVMFYDPYKQGFSYYSDQSISYPLLNAVAMKYVVQFRCRDLFFDQTQTPIDFPSALCVLQKEEEEKDMAEKKKTANKNGLGHLIRAKNGPFARLKSYSKSVDPIVAEAASKISNVPKAPLSESFKNKFIYLGRISNWKVLSPMKRKIAKLDGSVSRFLLDGIEKNSDTQKQVFNYRDFKKIWENKGKS